MTVRRAACGSLVALLLVLVAGCAGTQDHVLSFEPGQYRTQVRDLRIDVVGAHYAERQLTLECTVHNAGENTVTIEREGVLLDDDGLGIPPLDLTGQPTQFIIPAGESSTMGFAFEVGGLEPRVRTLGLWAIRSSRAPLAPLRVEVPGLRRQST